MGPKISDWKLSNIHWFWSIWPENLFGLRDDSDYAEFSGPTIVYTDWRWINPICCALRVCVVYVLGKWVWKLGNWRRNFSQTTHYGATINCLQGTVPTLNNLGRKTYPKAEIIHLLPIFFRFRQRKCIHTLRENCLRFIVIHKIHQCQTNNKPTATMIYTDCFMSCVWWVLVVVL